MQPSGKKDHKAALECSEIIKEFDFTFVEQMFYGVGTSAADGNGM